MKNSYTVANLFFIKKEKAGFRNIINWIHRNEEPPEVSLLKSVSSVITHIAIEMENSISQEEVIDKAEGYKLDKWVELELDLVRGRLSSDEVALIVKSMIEDI